MHHLIAFISALIAFDQTHVSASHLKNPPQVSPFNDSAQVRFESLVLVDVKLIDALKIIRSKAQDQGVSIEFKISNDPKGELASRTINVSMRNVTLNQLMNYLSLRSDFKFKNIGDTFEVSPK